MQKKQNKAARTALLGLLLAMLLFAAVPVPAGAQAAYASGPQTARAGQTLEVSFVLESDGALGFTGTLLYNTDMLTLLQVRQDIAAPWVVECTADRVVGYDDRQSSPLQGATGVFTAVFSLAQDLPLGTPVQVSLGAVTVSAGQTDTVLPDAAYAVVLSVPLSANCYLRSLQVAQNQLQPDFSPSVFAYDAGTVPFSVEELEVACAVQQENASVEISGARLAVGDNTVTLTVTAENGVQQKYTIAVHRLAQTQSQQTSSVNSDFAASSAPKATPAVASAAQKHDGFLPGGSVLLWAVGSALCVMAAGGAFYFCFTRLRQKIKKNKIRQTENTEQAGGDSPDTKG